MRISGKIAACVAALGSVLLAAGCGSGTDYNWARAAAAEDGGGMAPLVAAAKAEGQLNVIRLHRNLANYGALMKAFTRKYGIRITDTDPNGSSQDELDAVRGLRRQPNAPDVLDLATPFAIQADIRHLLDPYRVRTWPDIPNNLKAADATWYADYGGYVAFGYNPQLVSPAPTSFRSLLRPAYQHQVAMIASPAAATGNAAFDAVFAAALAKGGSVSNIGPGISYFRRLSRAGNFLHVPATAATVRTGRTPILVWQDFLLSSEIRPAVPGLRIVIPSDVSFADYFNQGISASAPHPAAARLWEEFLYSREGQNLMLESGARPAELAAMIKDGTVDKAALARLPKSHAPTAAVPTWQQSMDARTLVADRWHAEIIG